MSDRNHPYPTDSDVGAAGATGIISPCYISARSLIGTIASPPSASSTNARTGMTVAVLAAADDAGLGEQLEMLGGVLAALLY
jgi:hypothetical protein